MIYIKGSVAKFEGTPKELTFELTHLLLGFKYNMMKEFKLSEEEIYNVISKCGEIAFMSNKERQEYIQELESEEESE